MGASRSDADLVIAGYGAAGRSALWHVLMQGPPLGRIVVVDRAPEPGDDRTWAFWGRPGTAFAEVADRAWDDLLVRVPGWELRHRLVGRRYWRVRRRAYDEAVDALAASRPEVEIVTAHVLDVADEADGGLVRTLAGDLRAPVVFQSVAPRPTRAPRHPLRQHFGGWEVRTEHPVFDPTTVTFMDLDVAQADGLTFRYVLPEAPDRALVEPTVFSPTPREPAFYDALVAEYLDRLGAGSYEVERREYGSIPMEDGALAPMIGAHVHVLGGAGGRTKPSTGYAFQRIHAQAAHLARTWRTTGRPQPLPRGRRLHPVADLLLLHVLHRQPERAVEVFEALYRRNSLDHVLTFLDEDSHLPADLALMAKMPWAPFVRATLAEAVAALRHRSGVVS